MQIRVGYELIYQCPQPTPMMLTLNVHHSRAADIVVPDVMTTDPAVPISAYHDRFGNWCSRLVAPAGQIRITASGVVHDNGQADPVVPDAVQHQVQDLPDDVLVFLLGSRYCETDHLSETAWQLFGNTPLGWARVQAICDFVHAHIAFDYAHARPTRTAWEAFNERRGVCRDFATCRGAMPLHEHSGALLHRIPQRYRRAAAVFGDGFCRLVRGLSRRRVAYV